MASLKGPRHGGANSKVMDMMDDIKTHVRDWGSEGEITQYLTKLLDKEAFDRSGLIYGLATPSTPVPIPGARFSGTMSTVWREKRVWSRNWRCTATWRESVNSC